jgi:hypothetical protein
MIELYVLHNKKPVLQPDIELWANFMDNEELRRVALTEFNYHDYDTTIRVSTVFLGIDHGWDKSLRLFETMIFGKYVDGIDRSETWDDALLTHVRVCKFVENQAKELGLTPLIKAPII